MGFLSLFTGGLPFGGAIIAAIGIAFGGFWLYEHEQISALNTEVAGLHHNIDGPTGYIVQIGAVMNQAATLRANQKMLQASLMADDAAVAGWKAEADKASQRAALALAAADKATAEGEQQVAAILNVTAKGDVCTAALDLIHGAAIQ